MRLPTLLVLLAALPAVAPAVPLAPPPEDPSAPPAPDLWRRQEAALKERLAQKLLVEDGGATESMAWYDVTWYDLALDLDPDAQQLSGEVTITAVVVAPELQAFDLHLDDQLAVSAVLLGDVPLAHAHAQGVLTVTLPRAYSVGESFAVTVRYEGDPQGESFGWSSVNGQDLVWTLSEPYGARLWWPCKDLNEDKADGVDVRVTVPAGLVVASNGVLVSQQTAGGRTTFHWREGFPISTYLVSLAAHPYVVFSDWYVAADGDSLEVRNHVVPAYESQARTGYGVVPAMIAAFAQGFGEYPFMGEKYGHAHFPWGGGMEHQTCSSMAYSYYAQTFVAHELAHQWWGDMITCRTFHDIWLNEGFATWAEAYWREQNEGPEAYRDEMAAARYLGAGTVYVEEPYDFGGIFAYNLSYLKASWVVHMLRGALGDDDFFAGLALYRARHQYDAASTEDLQAALEDVSGRDLAAFMQQWIHGEYYPNYEWSFQATPHGDDTLVQVRIEQTQTNAGVFTMPIELVFLDDGGEEIVRRVENDRVVQHYSFVLPGTVTAMQFDPREWILKQATQVVPTDVPPAAAAPRLVAAPNPFNPSTVLSFALPADGPVTLTVFDARGRRVRELLAADLAAGRHEVRWDGRDAAGRPVAAGAYVARLRTAHGAAAGKLTLGK